MGPVMSWGLYLRMTRQLAGTFGLRRRTMLCCGHRRRCSGTCCKQHSYLRLRCEKLGISVRQLMPAIKEGLSSYSKCTHAHHWSMACLGSLWQPKQQLRPSLCGEQQSLGVGGQDLVAKIVPMARHSADPCVMALSLLLLHLYLTVMKGTLPSFLYFCFPFNKTQINISVYKHTMYMCIFNAMPNLQRVIEIKTYCVGMFIVGSIACLVLKAVYAPGSPENTKRL